MHFSVMQYRINAVHFPAGQVLLIWASYSSLKYRNVVRTGLEDVFPQSAKAAYLNAVSQQFKVVQISGNALSATDLVK